MDVRTEEDDGALLIADARQEAFAWLRSAQDLVQLRRLRFSRSNARYAAASFAP